MGGFFVSEQAANPGGSVAPPPGGESEEEMSRIGPLLKSEVFDEVRNVFEEIGTQRGSVPNMFRIITHRPQLMDEGEIVEISAMAGLFNYFNRVNALCVEPTGPGEGL